MDFVIAETFNWLGEALIAAEAHQGRRAPGDGHHGPRQRPELLRGVLAGRAAPASGRRRRRHRRHQLPARPASTRCPSCEEMRAAVSGVHIAAQPVAYHGQTTSPNFVSLPEFPYELEKIQLPRAAMADFAVKARDIGYRLHRLLLRLGRGPRQGDGKALGKTAGPRARVADQDGHSRCPATSCTVWRTTIVKVASSPLGSPMSRPGGGYERNRK